MQDRFLLRRVRILALSDTGFGENSSREYQRIFEESRPDIVVLAGDYDEGEALISPLARTLSLFYQFLEYCGKKSIVLVIKGNHETRGLSESANRYSPKKINSLRGCQEISDSRLVKTNGLSFLGIGYPKKLLPIVRRFEKSRVDVIITHCDKSRLKVLTRLAPKLIIHGHAASGPPSYMINQIPIISTGVLRFALIDFEGMKLEVVSQVMKERTAFIRKGELRKFMF